MEAEKIDKKQQDVPPSGSEKPDSITTFGKSSAPLYFNTKNSALYQGDVLYPYTFTEEFIDLIVTSPPYNVDIQYNSNNDDLTYEEYLDFTRKWITNVFSWTKNQGRFLLNIPLDKNKGGQKSVGADITAIAQQIGWHYHATIIWNEGTISRRTAWGSWLSASSPYVIAPVELILVLYKGEWKKTGGTGKSDMTKQEFIEWTNGLWTFSGESKKRIGHPAPFPLQLPYRALKLFSFVGDLVFDPFCGSGTTLIAAANNNRLAIGLEIDARYCAIAKKRIFKEVHTMQKDGFYKNGQKISELKGETLNYYYKSGNMKAQGPCIQGNFEGKWLFYTEKGTVIQEGNFKDNQKDGEWKRFNSEGELIYHAEFKKGKKVKIIKQ